MLKDVYDVKTVEGMSWGMSDHMVVLCKYKIVGVWPEKSLVDNTEVRVRSKRLPSEREREKYMRLLVSTDEEMWLIY